MQAIEEHREGLGEPFLASCFAYLEKASKDNLDEIVFLIQRILQLYAARQWSVVDAEGQQDALLQDILTSDPQNWESMIRDLATSGETLHQSSCRQHIHCVFHRVKQASLLRFLELQLEALQFLGLSANSTQLSTRFVKCTQTLMATTANRKPSIG